MLRRIGVFLAVLGIATLALFVMSDMAREPNGWLLFYGIILLGLAFGVLRITRGSAAPGSERFRLMRRLFGGGGKPSAPPPPAASAPPPPARKRGLFKRK